MRICHAFAWWNPVKNTAVKLVRKQDPTRWRSRASATMEPAQLPYEGQHPAASADSEPASTLWQRAKPESNLVGERGTNDETKHDKPRPSTLHEIKGEVKEQIGKATNDPNLEVSGKVEKKAGKVQEWIARTEKAVGE